MANFNRGNRGPVTMHRAVCDNCGKECQVPFRPTSGKPIFCSSCFENKRGSDDRRPSGGRNFQKSNFGDRPMFDTTCDNCGNSCKVPFQPRGDKPIYCSNCFENKGNNGNTQPQQKEQYKEQFEALNSKLERILKILEPINEEIKSEKVVKTKIPKKAASKE